MTIFTSFFLHAGWAHLLSNLYFASLVTIDAETRLGAMRLFALLALATVAAGATHALFEPRGEIPLVGASGGISGLIAYWALSFPKRRLHFFLFLNGFGRWSLLTRTGRYLTTFNIRISAPWVFALWVLIQVGDAFFQISGFGSVSALAHLGGAGVGVLWWLLTPKHEPERVHAIR